MYFSDTIAAGPQPFAPAVSRKVRPRTAPRISAWFAPDLALFAALVSVFYLVALFGGATALFRDSDAGWHIRLGESIVTSQTLPHSDPFSFSKAGQSWIAWEWLSDALAGSVHLFAGLTGVATLYAVAIAASVWMWFRITWTLGGNFFLACAFASPLLSTVNLHWLARPHVFSWLFLLGAVWFCESIPARLSPAALTTVALLSAVWANIHGSFILGPAIILLYGFGNWLSRALRGGTESPRPFLMTGFAAAAGTLLNPNGWNLHRHVFAYLADSALLDRIGEFQTFNFHAPGSAQIMLALLLGAAGGFAALTQHRAERFLLAMVLIAAALRSARMLPIAALLLLPLANASFTALLGSAHFTPHVRGALDKFLNYSNRLRDLDTGLKGYALIPVAIILTFATMHATHPAFPADQFPVAAATSVAALPSEARIFAPDKFGGYLIYRFNGTRKVFFDGRSDFYGAGFLQRYSRMVQVRPGWSEEFNKWRFTHALLPVDYSLVPALESQGWTELHRDRTSVLLARPVTGEPKA